MVKYLVPAITLGKAILGIAAMAAYAVTLLILSLAALTLSATKKLWT
jgi:hypothetical protein